VIPVSPRSEPPDFDQKVRAKGKRFLKNAATPVQWDGHEYWRAALGDLREGYDSICAYLVHWIPPGTGFATVDHFVPRSVRRDLAYEWSNYRLACGAINSKKREYQDVVDPFSVEDGWFALDFPSLQVRCGVASDRPLRMGIEATINRLDLNCESFVQERWHWLEEFCRNQDMDSLRRHAPFIAHELVRQKLEGGICQQIRRRLKVAPNPRPEACQRFS